MESIKTVLFEAPLPIYLILGLAGAVVIYVRYSAGRSGRWMGTWLAVLAVLAGATFTVERLVVTDREQIELALQDIAASIPTGRVDHAVSYLDEKYLGWGRKHIGSGAARILVAATIRNAVRTYGVKRIALGKPQIEVSGQLASCHVIATITCQTGASTEKYITAWDVRWIKRPEGWRIEGAEPTSEILP